MADQPITVVPTAPEIIQIDDIDTFAKFVGAWHATQVETLRHFLQVPPGSSFQVGEKTVVMDPATLEGFKLGLEIALMHVGNLPFQAEIEDEPTL
jgi:hypothetical protein